DHIVGVLYAKDLLRAVVRGEQKTLREIARKPYFTPESNKVQDVLRDLRKNRVHMAIVVDEYGGTAGAVTIEDILEEIVGPIQDEYDIGEEDEIQFISPNEVILDGRVSVDDVNELLKLDPATSRCAPSSDGCSCWSAMRRPGGSAAPSRSPSCARRASMSRPGRARFRSRPPRCWPGGCGPGPTAPMTSRSPPGRVRWCPP